MRPLINPIRTRAEQEIPLVESRVNGGMVTSIDATDIENNQFQDVKGFRVRDDRTSRKVGSDLFTPAKPDSESILLLTPYKRFDKSIKLLRFTKNSINLYGSIAWTPLTGTITGSETDRFSTSVINDRFFFANGIDKVQELDTTALTYADAGNWDIYKYITGSFNRLVGVCKDDNPVKIGWSGDLNFLETDPSVDFSAGFDFLAESPSDYADFPTGLVGFPATLLIPKERSIWGGIKQPSASNPFLFQTIIPGTGCDCPYSVQKIPNGIAWVDFRTARVYTYIIGSQLPTPIGGQIERTLIRQITDPLQVFSDYNGLTNEYSIAIPTPNSTTVKVWTFNFRTSTWVYDEMELISAINSVDFATGSLQINDLVGSMDNLVGSFNSLSSSTVKSIRFIGQTDGELLLENENKDKDNNIDYTSSIISKIFELPTFDEYISQVRIEYLCNLSGSFSIQYKKDEDDWVVAKNVVMTTGINRKLVNFKKNIRCRQFQWRLVSTSGLFDILEYEVLVIPGSKSTR